MAALASACSPSFSCILPPLSLCNVVLLRCKCEHSRQHKALISSSNPPRLQLRTSAAKKSASSADDSTSAFENGEDEEEKEEAEFAGPIKRKKYGKRGRKVAKKDNGKLLMFGDGGGVESDFEENEDTDEVLISRSSAAVIDDEFATFFDDVEKAVDIGRNNKAFNQGSSYFSSKKTREFGEARVQDVSKKGKSATDHADYELKAEDDVSAEEDAVARNSREGAAAKDNFDLDLSALGLSSQLLEPSFSTTLAELLDDAKVVPVSADGDLEVEITGIQHDSREANPGDLFVCCSGMTADVHSYLTEAFKRGAVAIIAANDIIIDDSIAVKALVTVEDINSVLPALAASFYGNPSNKLAVLGVTGTSGKTVITYFLKSIYETMGVKTGLVGTIAHYIQDKHIVEASDSSSDAVHLQKLMAKMVHNGTEACIMEVSSHALKQGCCGKVDFDVAVFMNISRDTMNTQETDEEYLESKLRLFEKMIDPERHRKVVNIDDPNAIYFIGKGNSQVPVITFSVDNRSADVYAMDVQLSLFETQVLVKTPKGSLEISSGLLGRGNVYNILAAVSVGVAVGAPLDDIVNGIEEVDTVSGQCELIDEEQPFAVIVDHARTPHTLSRLLDTVRECGAKRIITVFGCEGERDRGIRPLMTKIATDKSEVCILTSDNPRTEDPLDILDDMLAGVGWTMHDYLQWADADHYPSLRNGHRLFVYDIRAIAHRIAIAMAQPGDAVVISGKGHEKFHIIGIEKKSFDDVEECREALQYVDTIHAAGINTSELPWRFPESY